MAWAQGGNGLDMHAMLLPDASDNQKLSATPPLNVVISTKDVVLWYTQDMDRHILPNRSRQRL